MLRAAILLIILATVIATYLTQSFVAPPIGAGVLFGVLLAAWLFNRRGSDASVRQAEEATHRQREERARGADGSGGHSPP